MGIRSLLDRFRDVARSEHLQIDQAQPDDELLDRFVRFRDEVAFEAILRRHGPLVYSVCGRLLYSPDDTADAFQATFLILACKAGAIGQRSLLANWLYGVAYRVATRARKNRLRRQLHERHDVEMSSCPEPPKAIGSAFTQELCEEVLLTHSKATN
jgi:DNA-directed RNA polymerase specialized sigma24 family protein